MTSRGILSTGRRSVLSSPGADVFEQVECPRCQCQKTHTVSVIGVKSGLQTRYEGWAGGPSPFGRGSIRVASEGVSCREAPGWS